jgi:hypothetical protein
MRDEVISVLSPEGKYVINTVFIFLHIHLLFSVKKLQKFITYL